MCLRFGADPRRSFLSDERAPNRLVAVADSRAGIDRQKSIWKRVAEKLVAIQRTILLKQNSWAPEKRIIDDSVDRRVPAG